MKPYLKKTYLKKTVKNLNTFTDILRNEGKNIEFVSTKI